MPWHFPVSEIGGGAKKKKGKKPAKYSSFGASLHHIFISEVVSSQSGSDLGSRAIQGTSKPERGGLTAAWGCVLALASVCLIKEE